MTVHQLSVYIENKSGALVSVLRLLKQEKIQLIASTIADTVDYGIFRIICSQPEKAYHVLKDAGVAVSLCEVFAVELDDRPGMAADAIELFASEGISLAYLYSFLLNGKGVLVFRTDHAEKAAEVITSHGLHIIKEKDLSRLLQDLQHCLHALADAKAKGYTEPDPTGETLEKAYQEASGAGKRLRYLAVLQPGGGVWKACASLQAVGPENPLYHLRGTENCAIFTPEDYPAGLVIQGAGAGARQTAGGVLMDIIA